MAMPATASLYPFLPLDPSLHSSPSRIPPAHVRFVRFLPSFLWGSLRGEAKQQQKLPSLSVGFLSPLSPYLSPCASLFRNPLASSESSPLSLSLSSTFQLLVPEKTEIFLCKFDLLPPACCEKIRSFLVLFLLAGLARCVPGTGVGCSWSRFRLRW
jgi:hypothetical protein